MRAIAYAVIAAAFVVPSACTPVATEIDRLHGNLFGFQAIGSRREIRVEHVEIPYFLPATAEDNASLRRLDISDAGAR